MFRPARPILVLALVLPLLTSALVAPLSAGEPAWTQLPRGCVDHAAISIAGDVGQSGFVLGFAPATGTPIYRPGSGIFAGSGTREDPFIMEGLCVQGGKRTALTGATPAISIRDASSHVVIRGIAISSSKAGIVLEGVSNVTIMDSELGGALPILEFDEVADVTVTNVRFVGTSTAVDLRQARNVTFRENTFALSPTPLGDTALFGIRVESSTFEENEFTAGYGVSFGTCPGVQLIRNVFNQTDRSIDLRDCDDAIVKDNTILGGSIPMAIRKSDGVDVSGNAILATSHGILVSGVTASDIRDNVVPRITLDRSNEVALTGNSMAKDGLSIYAEKATDGLHRISSDNTEDGTPIRYSRNLNGGAIDGGVGRIIVASSSGVRITNQTFENLAEPIFLLFSSGITVADSTFTNVSNAIHARSASSNSVRHNQFISVYTGVYLDGSRGNSVASNEFTGRGESCTSIKIYGSPDNVISQNVLAGCAVGIDLGPSSRNNAIQGNTIANHSVGVLSRGGGVGNDGSTIRANNVTSNTIGLSIVTVPLRVEANNFWNNAEGVNFTSSLRLNATANWWGCTLGPNDPDCDSVGSRVDFTPWLTAPHAAAGAR